MTGHWIKVRKSVIACILIIGTGCFSYLLWKQNSEIENLEQYLSKKILECGFQSVEYTEYLSGESPTDKWSRWIAQIPVVYYLSGGAGTLEAKAEKEITGMAALYPGKNNTNIFWSGAASEKIAETRLFENLDENILLAQQEEQQKKSEADDSLEAAALEENQNWTEQLDDSEDETDGTKEARESSSINITQNRAGLQANLKKIQRLESSLDRNYLLKNFYIVDSSTSIDKNIFDVEKLLKTDLSLKKKNEPQILIYHTHGASESFVDSKEGEVKDSIIGVGAVLADILEEKYGYQVIHDTTEYDRIDGKIDRNKAYNKSYAGVSRQLKEHPQIQVIIDLHRDGVGNNVQRTTVINGKKTAQVMFFNGLSRNRNGNIKYLKNKNLADNLAFSLQMKLKCMQSYPDFAKPVYLKSYRYNLHLRKRALLVELGNENNTVEEAKNAMEPLAQILNEELSGK